MNGTELDQTTILPDPRNRPIPYYHFLFLGEYYFRTLITEFLHLMQWFSVYNLCFPLTYPMKMLAFDLMKLAV